MTRINTNVSSLVARNTLGRSNAALEQALTRLSTGLRINTGKDDPAGLIASENLRSDITSIQKAISNTERANQVIATADSALGQVSSLLNDIRGLVTESANNGALSEAQIAANQLQIDSSLEALNRIAQTTTFQGRKLLDGSLDFITSTSDSDFANIASLQIDQANLGASGTVPVSISVSAAAIKGQINVASIPAGGGSPVAATTTATFSVSTAGTAATGTVDFDVDVAAEDATATFTGFSTSVSGALAFNSSGNYTAADGNNLRIVFAEDDTATTHGASLDTTDPNDHILTITVGTDDGGSDDTPVDLDAVFTYLQANVTAFSDIFDYTANDVTGNFVPTTDAAATITFADGADATTATGSIDIASLATGSGGNLSLTFVEGLSAGVSDDGSGAYTITYLAGASLSDIVALLENGTITELDAAATGVATGSSGSSTVATGGGPSGAQAITGYDAPTTGSDVITITAATAGTAGNGKTVTVNKTSDSSLFNASTGVGVAVDGSGNITLSLDDSNAAIAISAIVAALDGTTEYAATATPGTGTFDATTATAPTVANTAGGTAGGGLADKVVFELAGSTGSEVLSFGAGTSISQIVTGINLVKDATGVEATASGTTLQLVTTGYGKASVVDIRIISEGTGTTPAGVFSTAVGQRKRQEGADIVASVNGIEATGRGNSLSINTATLDLSTTLVAGFTGEIEFSIAGGGALFQLGPDVVSNQQVRLGIGSVNAARLGGVSGKLYELGSGGSADLATDLTKASAVVAEAIDQVTTLRGRLGAFQRTLLETNKNALGDTLVNLTEAESQIRDADFAAESAALTRAQILVQSGTTVLQIANSNPQNVLALLR